MYYCINLVVFAYSGRRIVCLTSLITIIITHSTGYKWFFFFFDNKFYSSISLCIEYNIWDIRNIIKLFNFAFTYLGFCTIIMMIIYNCIHLSTFHFIFCTDFKLWNNFGIRVFFFYEYVMKLFTKLL